MIRFKNIIYHSSNVSSSVSTKRKIIERLYCYEHYNNKLINNIYLNFPQDKKFEKKRKPFNYEKQIKSHTTNRAALLSFFLITPQSLSLSLPLPLCAGEKMASCKQWTVFLSLLCLVSATVAAPPKKPVAVPFGRNYMPTWAFDHIKYFNGGKEIQLHLDKYTGTGFQSKGNYLFGHFHMQIKMVPGDSAGTVTAYYLSSQNNEHDEIDFEFLGNRTGQPYILQTNVFTGGKGDREQRIFLWFDPTAAYHSYAVLWNLYQIVFLVDDIPIRVFKNSKDLGVKFPFNQPMKLYSSLWNADDWATRGGLEKTDWSKAPFIANYRGFHIDGCEASVEAKYCATQGKRWWDQKEFQDLDAQQWRRLRWVRKKFTIYNYCTDRVRYPSMPPECKRDRDI